ncbi:hypothetical protein JB92DRAFT_3022124 [Gautieria morchelliformis]|nr:hypothetical protein JB92DRAFT_3022124 [Gautieria morchelliformis]
MSISPSSSGPSWFCTPSPCFLPAPSVLVCGARRASSPVLVLAQPPGLPSPESSHIPLDDDELTWKRLEKAISDCSKHGNSDQTQNEQADYVTEPSSSTPETSLDDATSCSGSSDMPTFATHLNKSTFQPQSFRPLSALPEHNFAAIAARQAVSKDPSDVSETDVPATVHGLKATYLASELSSWPSSSLFLRADPFSLNSKNNSLAPFSRVSLTVQGQGNSLFSSSPSSGTSKDDEERRHIHAAPINLGSRYSCLDLSPMPQRTPDIVDRLSHFTPMPFKLSHNDIIIFVENTFDQVVSTGDSAAVLQVLSLWDGGHFIPDGFGTISARKWDEFISQTLVRRIRREFKVIAALQTGDLFSTRVAPILKFVFLLQALPSAAQKAQRALGTLVDAILHSHTGTKDSACVIAKRINFLLDYFRPSMKGILDSSWVAAWQSLRSAGLSFIHGKLRFFVRLCIENSSRERYEKDSVLFLATFLAQLNPRKLLRKVLPIKKLVKLLNDTERATRQPCAVKAAATLLLMVCSDAETAGCVACWKNPPNEPRHRRNGTCACTAYSEWLSYEFQVTRSLVRHRVLDEAFESLEGMDAMEKYVSILTRE